MAVRKATRMCGARGQLRTRPVVSPASSGSSAGDWDEVDSPPPACRLKAKRSLPPSHQQGRGEAGGRGLPRGRGGRGLPGAQVGSVNPLVPFSLQQLHVNLVTILASRWSLLDPDQS